MVESCPKRKVVRGGGPATEELSTRYLPWGMVCTTSPGAWHVLDPSSLWCEFEVRLAAGGVGGSPPPQIWHLACNGRTCCVRATSRTRIPTPAAAQGPYFAEPAEAHPGCLYPVSMVYLVCELARLTTDPDGYLDDSRLAQPATSRSAREVEMLVGAGEANESSLASG